MIKHQSQDPKFYDSDLESVQEQFDSDKDLPSDKERERKLIHKEKEGSLYNISKEILKAGQGLNKPAKYDEIEYRYVKVEDPSKPDLIQSLQQVEYKKLNIGLMQSEKWLDTAVQTMKKQEISLIIIENLKKDQNDMKVLESTFYYVIELKDFITIIDLDQNFYYMKTILQRGIGHDRCSATDELAYFCELKFQNFLLYSEDVKIPKRIKISIDDEINGIPKVVWRVMKSMKQDEQVQCKIKMQAFLEQEKQVYKNKIPNASKENEDLVATIKIYKIICLDDVFNDGSVLKRQVQKGVSTSKPEKISKISFHIQIVVNDEQIYTTKSGKEEETDFWLLYLDELQISKMLKHCLLRTKKKEVSSIECKDPTLIQYGKDYNILMEKYKSIPNTVKYVVEVIDFTEGKNTFNMTIDEKIDQAQRKKQIGLKLIQELNCKKALKVFESINAYFELGNFYGEDKIHVTPHHLSSLMNTTLCLMKMENWKQLLLVGDKIINEKTGIDPSNAKAIYRYVLALSKTMEYEKGIAVLKNYLNQYKSKIDKWQLDDLEKMLNQLEESNKKYLKKESQIYKNLFA